MASQRSPFSKIIAVLTGLCMLAFTSFSVSDQRSPSTKKTGIPVAEPQQTYTLYGGPWRSDGGFVSTIRIKNSLAVAPLDVIPVLYMADGTEYRLPPVKLAISGVATVDVNAALRNAPSSLASHVSNFGSAALIYRYSSTGHVIGSMSVIDEARSLSFTFPFDEPGVMHDPEMRQTLEGLWWKHDGGVHGFVTLSNSTEQTRDVKLQLITANGSMGTSRVLRVQAHATAMVDLEELSRASGESDAGGIRVTYNGIMGAISVTGGLMNESEGYSANIPFWMRPMDSSEPTKITYASAGLMVGKPEPMEGFPADTVFSPYLAVRNTTSKPLGFDVQLNLHDRRCTGNALAAFTNAASVRGAAG